MGLLVWINQCPIHPFGKDTVDLLISIPNTARDQSQSTLFAKVIVDMLIWVNWSGINQCPIHLFGKDSVDLLISIPNTFRNQSQSTLFEKVIVDVLIWVYWSGLISVLSIPLKKTLFIC